MSVIEDMPKTRSKLYKCKYTLFILLIFKIKVNTIIGNIQGLFYFSAFKKIFNVFLLVFQLFCQSMSEFSGIQETLKHIESDSHLDSQLEYISMTHNIYRICW